MGNRTTIKKVCPTCHARGGGCGTCGGVGYLNEYIEDGKYYALCPSCYGGHVYNGQFGCSTCGGSGYKWTYIDEPRSSSSSSTSDGDGGSCLAIIILAIGILVLMIFAAILFFTPLIAFVIAPIFLILELSGFWGKNSDGKPLDPKRFFTTVELALLYATTGAFLIWRFGAGGYTGFAGGIDYAAWVANFDLFGKGAIPSAWVIFAVSIYGPSGWRIGLFVLIALFFIKVALHIPGRIKRSSTIAVVVLMIFGVIYFLPGLFGNGNTTVIPRDTTSESGQVGAQSASSNIKIGYLVLAENIDRDGCAVNIISSLRNSDRFYVIAPDSELPAGTTIFARLYRGDIAIEDLPLITADQDYTNTCINFVFETTNGNNFESGNYEVELFVNGNSYDSVTFSIN